MLDIYKLKIRPKAKKENMVQRDNYRITLLTEGLLRLEYSYDGIFEDRATAFAFYRDFPQTDFRVVETADGIEIHTSRIHLVYNEKEFSAEGLSIQVKGNLSAYHSIWHYGEKGEYPFFPLYEMIQKESRLPILIAGLHTMNLEDKLLSVMLELITAKVDL